MVDGRSLKSRLLKWLQCILNKDWPIWSTNHNQVLFHNKTYCCWINWWGSLAENILKISRIKKVLVTKEYRALDFWMKNVLRHVVEANWIIFYGFFKIFHGPYHMDRLNSVKFPKLWFLGLNCHFRGKITKIIARVNFRIFTKSTYFWFS